MQNPEASSKPTLFDTLSTGARRLSSSAWAPRFLSLAYCAPLLLMVLCGALLMSRFSGDWVTVSKNAAPLEQELTPLANDLFNRGAGLAAWSVKIGVGGYLAALAGAWFALQGVRLGFRK